MEFWLNLWSTLILCLVWYIYTIQMSRRKMPPGPMVLPLVGSLPAIFFRLPTLKVSQFRPWVCFDLLCKEYGPIFSFSAFNIDAGIIYAMPVILTPNLSNYPQNTVVIASHELFEEVANMEEYSIKFSHELYTYPRTFGKELGLLCVSTPRIWTELRKFTLRTLREFGFGKSYTMHSVIVQEVNLLMEEFRNKMEPNKDGGIIQFHNTFSLSVLNVLWCMVAGIRYEHDDSRLRKLLEETFKYSKALKLSDPFDFVAPFLNKIAPQIFKAGGRFKMPDELHSLSKNLAKERMAEGSYLSEPQNYIDVFLRKIQEHKTEEGSLFKEEQLQSVISDLLLVGTVTLDSTLNYAVLFLTLNPYIQKKCQEEIDSVVPRHMTPTVDDVERMPYFQAFILETHRCANILPNPIPRITPRDWNFKGYHIPKGTIIVSNHFSVNTDKNIWGDADTFRPERFINEKGEFAPDPRVVVFGFGKRNCLGIQLVNSVLPLFLSLLLKNFNFSVVPGTNPPTTEAESGATCSPKKFPVYMTTRSL